jgi:deoxyribodipyrimidine photolyase-related protein
MNLLIFPTQLYYNTKHIDKDSNIYLIEEPRFFTDFKFHKLKLAYHRATMKKYFDHLIKKNYNVKYIDFNKVTDSFYKSLKSATCVNLADTPLDNKLKELLDLTVLDNINFLVSINELEAIKKEIYSGNRYSNNSFYKYQRRKLNILMTKDNKPIGGKWSFDKENRLPLPKDHIVPDTPNKVITNKYTKEAIKYVEKHFPDNYGSLDYFIYPIDNTTSKKWLMKFLNERLQNFGIYEDAISSNYDFVYHSVISPMLNIGIITDKEVLDISYNYYLKHKKTIPIRSIEAFIRQLIGWRNYVYVLYELEGNNMKKNNLLNAKNNIDYEKFWTGTTGLLPVDNAIKKIIKYAYAHHIERLMILGNILLLLQIKPIQVYNIFMEWTIDSYDWVMCANVYGMSQSTTDIMMSRPYFSSSNYIIKMSDYKKDDWSNIWNTLYYNFINKHINLFKNNYAIAMQVKHWKDKTKSEKDTIIKKAKQYIKLNI